MQDLKLTKKHKILLHCLQKKKEMYIKCCCKYLQNIFRLKDYIFHIKNEEFCP